MAVDTKVDNKKKKEEKSKAGFKIGEFLQSPRRKRKQYIQLALSESFDKDLKAAIEVHLQRAYPQQTIAMPLNDIEFRRQLGRNITVSIIDDQFASTEEVMESVLFLKQRKQDQGTPVLFLTKKPDELIRNYHTKLLTYQENDDYIDYASSSREQIFSRIKNALEFKGKRRSRRFKVDIPVVLYHLEHDEKFSGSIVDMSIHGALIRASEEIIFRLGDQLRLNIPVLNYLPSEQGDFLKIAAKVKRVYIGGDTVGISFEHLSEYQALRITKFLTNLVSSQIARSGIMTTSKMRASL